MLIGLVVSAQDHSAQCWQNCLSLTEQVSTVSSLHPVSSLVGTFDNELVVLPSRRGLKALDGPQRLWTGESIGNPWQSESPILFDMRF